MSVKRSFDTHLIPGLLRSYAAPAILHNIRNPHNFLWKMATYSCFWRVPRSELFLQASLRQISNLLTLVSFHMLIYSTLFHCQSKVSWTRSFIFSPYSCIIIQHQWILCKFFIFFPFLSCFFLLYDVYYALWNSSELDSVLFFYANGCIKIHCIPINRTGQ